MNGLSASRTLPTFINDAFTKKWSIFGVNEVAQNWELAGGMIDEVWSAEGEDDVGVQV